ncbi:MAG TPA: hypothetical protein VNE62_00855, partial [Actinomycetota bacterium]|nr:hypothetical protein [Actinomycetota bacterium]
DPPEAAPDPAPCDFCEGREDRTPPETYGFRPGGGEPGTSGWWVRSFSNKFPGAPFHEVVVHSPRHDARFEDLTSEHRLQILRAYRERMSASGRRAFVAAFNRGREAGASRSHEHSQLFGLDVVPPTLEREAEAFASDECVLCSLVTDEQLVARHGEVSVVAHPAPLLAREMLIVPGCAPRFDRATDGTLEQVGDAVADAILRLRRVLRSHAPCNLVVHVPPAGASSFHWHAHLYPRTSIPGALEVGADLPLVGVDPAESARELRDAVSG